MSLVDLNGFRQASMSDTGLQTRLKQIDASTVEEYAQGAVEIGRESGYTFTIEEVMSCLSDSSDDKLWSPANLDTLIDSVQNQLVLPPQGNSPGSDLYCVIRDILELPRPINPPVDETPLKERYPFLQLLLNAAALEQLENTETRAAFLDEFDKCCQRSQPPYAATREEQQAGLEALAASNRWYEPTPSGVIQTYRRLPVGLGIW